MATWLQALWTGNSISCCQQRW